MISILTKFDSIKEIAQQYRYYSRHIPLLTIYERKLRPIYWRIHYIHLRKSLQGSLARTCNERIMLQERGLNVNYILVLRFSLIISKTPETWIINHENLICRSVIPFPEQKFIEKLFKAPKFCMSRKQRVKQKRFQIFLGIQVSLCMSKGVNIPKLNRVQAGLNV